MKKEQIQLLAIGDSSIDQILSVEDNFATEQNGEICFIHGTKIPVDSFNTSIAGNALNVSVGTQMLGVDTHVYTEVGDDQNAQRIIDELNAIGVNTKYCLKNKDTLTDIHPIIVYREERTIFIYHEKRDYKVRNWGPPKWIYYSSIGKNFEGFQKELVEYLNKNPKVGVAFNPGTYHLKGGVEAICDFLQITHILFVNKDEAIQLTENAELLELHKNLQKLGPKLTVITDGGNGASAYDGKDLIHEPSYHQNKPILDTTGAGDAFSSGFLAAIIHSRPLREAVRWGVVNSSSVIREIGAIHGLKNQKEIKEMINYES